MEVKLVQEIEQYPDEYEIAFQIAQEWDERGAHTNTEDLRQLNETMVARCEMALPDSTGTVYTTYSQGQS